MKITQRKVKKAAHVLLLALHAAHDTGPKSDAELIIEAFLFMNMGAPLVAEMLLAEVGKDV